MKRRKRRAYRWDRLATPGATVKIKAGGATATSAAYQYAARAGIKITVHTTPGGTVEVTRL